MYIPPAFLETDPAKLHAAIERYSFATLVSGSADGLTASHLPLLLDRATGENGTLIGHMARANSQWQEAADSEVLAIFSGPHAYISPRWYEASPVVPTWNYVAIHAYGQLELIADPAEAEAVLRQTVQNYEAALPEPWQLNEPPQFVAALVEQIVAFRIPISRLEGKWKLNQNRPKAQQQRVIHALTAQGDENSREIASLMPASNPPLSP